VAIVGQETVSRAPGFAFLELDLLKVKGKTAATRIFALLGDAALKESESFKDLTAKHQEFLARYRAKDWDAAEALSAECEEIAGPQLHRLYELYRERIAAFRVTPPPDNWDGTAEALSK